MDNRYQVTHVAELESLSLFRGFIDDICKKYTHIKNEDRYDLKLAVDEACTNIITHGYAGLNPGTIILNIDVYSDKAVVTLTDFGHPFEPSEAPAPDVASGLEDRPMGGFGLFFIYETMDQVDYKSGEDGNRLIFIKKLE